MLAKLSNYCSLGMFMFIELLFLLDDLDPIECWPMLFLEPIELGYELESFIEFRRDEFYDLDLWLVLFCAVFLKI